MKILSYLSISLIFGCLTSAYAEVNDHAQVEQMPLKITEMGQMNQQQRTEITILNNGSMLYPAGTFPNADSREKNAECAAQGLINFTPQAVVVVSALGEDATICVDP